jgi:hypothetical protein
VIRVLAETVFQEISAELFLALGLLFIMMIVLCVISARLFHVKRDARAVADAAKEMVAREAQAHQQRSELARGLQWLIDEKAGTHPPPDAQAAGLPEPGRETLRPYRLD